jgi:hypothetical protein
LKFWASGLGATGKNMKTNTVASKRKALKREAEVSECETVLKKGESATHAELQNMPKTLPRLKREGGIGSSEIRRNIMQPMHIM